LYHIRDIEVTFSVCMYVICDSVNVHVEGWSQCKYWINK